MMTLSNVVAAVLTTTPELIVGRDEKGAFIQYDSIQISLTAGTVRLMSRRTEIGTLKLTNGPITGSVDTIVLEGLEGRVRLTSS